MKSSKLRCQIFGLKINVIVGDDYDPFVGEYMIHWVGHDDERATMFINGAATEPKNHHILWNGIFHDLFEITCWSRGIYDYETESFAGFGHVFYQAAVTRVCNVGQRLFNKITETGKAKPKHGKNDKCEGCGVPVIHPKGSAPVCPKCKGK